jgi:hypothetical protein
VPAVSYIAKRSLVPGHTVGFAYDLDLRAVGCERAPEGDRIVKWPISGRNPELIRHGGWDTWEVTLVPLRSAPLDAAIEFLESVDDQSFTFDPYGTIAAPGTKPMPFVAVLVERYRIQRAARVKQGGGLDWFQLAFRVRPT